MYSLTKHILNLIAILVTEGGMMEQAIKQAKISEWVSISNKLANEFNIEKYLPRDDIDNQILYHYTSLDALLSMCRNNSIWLSRIDSLNDPTDGKTLVESLKELLNSHSFAPYQYLNETKYPLNENIYSNSFDLDINVYVLSLVSDGDSLTMWRFYGHNAIGCSLGIDKKSLQKDMYIKDLNKGIKPRLFFKKVNYGKEKHEPILLQVVTDFHNLLQDIKDQLKHTDISYYTHVLVKWLQSLSPFFKDDCYSHENEVRLVYDFTDKNGHLKDYLRYRLVNDKIVPYIELINSNELKQNEISSFIQSITLGCKSNPDNIHFLKEMYLRNQNNLWKYKDINKYIFQSDKPYR